MSEKSRKNLSIGMLIVAICLLTVGYAALSQQLNVKGVAAVSGSWDVHLDNLNELYVSDTAEVKVGELTNGNTTVDFDFELLQPGDSVTYSVDIINNGTIDAKLEGIDQTLENANSEYYNQQIVWSYEGIEEGDIIKASERKTVKITAAFPESASSVDASLSRNFTVIFLFGQANK